MFVFYSFPSWGLQTHPMASLSFPQGPKLLSLKYIPPWVMCEASRWA